MGPGMGPMGPGAGGPGQRKEKKEGPAEEAPKDEQALKPIEPVPAQPEGYRRVQLFELHGYFRSRLDYFHRLDMGLEPPLLGIDNDNKFFRPPSEHYETNPDAQGDTTVDNQVNCVARLGTRDVNAGKIAQRCNRRNGFGSANLRLRLEPTIHISDTIKVHAQIDALDNIVFGSTPDSFAGDNPFAPIDMFTRTQVPPTAGYNAWRDSILVKRAYAHVRFGWGLDIKVGRMPWHWGMGIVANDGNGYYRGERGDIVRMLDMDYGDSIDSVRLAYNVGRDRRSTHEIAASWDWASSGPTTSQLLGPAWDSGNLVGQDFSIERYDNVYQWSLAVLRRDSVDMLQRKLSLGTPVVNYGAIAWLRHQTIARPIGAPGLGDGLGTNPAYLEDYEGTPDPYRHNGVPLGNGDSDSEGDSGYQNYANMLVHRRALVFTPDVWFRVNWRTLRVELEAAAVIGRFYHRDLDDAQTPTGSNDYEQIESYGGAFSQTRLTQFGYALEFKYGLFQDRFHIGLDQGFASGDESDNPRHNYQNPLLRPSSAGNTTFSQFRFNPAYMQDLLLFREFFGTVSNAAYIKPWAAFYFFDGNFSGRLDVEYAVAHQRVSTYANKQNWGIELDAAFRYHDRREPVFIQLQYGVLFPLGAFNRPDNLYPGASNDPKGDAKAVQTIQAQLGVRF